MKKITIKEAIKSIATPNTLLGSIAKSSLEDPIKTMEFVCYIYDQSKQGNEETLKKKYGTEIINTIIDYRKDIINSVPCLEHEKEINKMLREAAKKYPNIIL